MSIPQGATHVDKQADGCDYYALYQGDWFLYEGDGEWLLCDKPADVEVINQSYKDQFEPWVPHWWVLPECVTPETAHTELIANMAIERAMRC